MKSNLVKERDVAEVALPAQIRDLGIRQPQHTRIDRGVVLAATGSPAQAGIWMDRLMRGAESLRERDPATPIVALEYLIPSGAGVDWDPLLSQIEDAYRDREFDWRITVGSLTPATRAKLANVMSTTSGARSKTISATRRSDLRSDA